ncbi:AI-2E family transporter [Coprobacter secundus]|uniref:AI-2E family transporter n=1 Tax=Coprobacter secundus TaxID=1501392 RepID=UPI0023F87C2F|nr:AI-2E family transporter [Coprobacter secundus]
MYISRRPYTFDRVIRILFTIAIVVGIFYLIDLLKGALLPFLVAWLLAYLIHPLVDFFKKKCHIRNNFLAIVTALISIILFFSLLGWIFIPSILDEIDKIKIMIQDYSDNEYNIPFLPESWKLFIQENIDFERIAGMMNKEDWSNLVKKALSETWIIISGSVSQIITIVSWFIVLIYLIFILLDYDKIICGFRNMIPRQYRRPVLSILSDVQVSMNRYFRGQALVAFIVGILFSIGFLIVGMPLAIVLGLFIGLLNMVPYLQIIGFIPTILLCLLRSAETNENFWVLFAACLVVFIVVQLIQDLFLVPRIMGHVTGLNPAIILLSLSIWGSLLGIIGMIIALPLTTLLLAYYQKYILHTEPDEKKKSQLPSRSKREKKISEK